MQSYSGVPTARRYNFSLLLCAFARCIYLILLICFPSFADLKVLVFSGMNGGFYHESIPAGIAAIKEIGIKRGWAALGAKRDELPTVTAVVDEAVAQLARKVKRKRKR